MDISAQANFADVITYEIPRCQHKAATLNFISYFPQQMPPIGQQVMFLERSAADPLVLGISDHLITYVAARWQYKAVEGSLNEV